VRHFYTLAILLASGVLLSSCNFFGDGPVELSKPAKQIITKPRDGGAKDLRVPEPKAKDGTTPRLLWVIWSLVT
jgi:hypothetical protein